MSTSNYAYRYPGVKPFAAWQNELFFGRERDISDLFDLIQVEKIVVLYGKSGYGKSSLLNAGIVPMLKNRQNLHHGYVPVLVRLGNYSQSYESFYRTSLGYQNHTPLETLSVKLNEQTDAETTPEADILLQLTGKKSLWYELKYRQNLDKPQRFVLIFDQFEEFFSYPVHEQQAFKNELAELLYQDVPLEVKESSSSLDRSLRLFLAEPLDVRIVFSIRSDHMSLLDTMKNQFPAILNCRFQLKGLTTEQARESITRPAGLNDLHFLTPAFRYSEAAIEKMLEDLSAKGNQAFAEEGSGARVEAFQLQILCEYIESQLRIGVIKSSDDQEVPVVELENLPAMSNLYENYYYRKLQEFNPEEQKYVQLILEDGLLIEDVATGEGRRMSVDSRALKNQFQLDVFQVDLLDMLSNTFLIRPESNSVGGFNYEISHDTLVAPIMLAKKRRKSREEHESALSKQKTTEAMLKQEAARRKAAERATQQTRLLAGTAIAGLLCSIVALVWALSTREEARTALQNFTKAQLLVNKRDLEIALKEAYGQLGGGETCVETVTAQRLENLAGLIHDEDAAAKIRKLNNKIKQNNSACPIIRIKNDN